MPKPSPKTKGGWTELKELKVCSPRERDERCMTEVTVREAETWKVE